MDDGRYWQMRAAAMREQAAQIRDPFISGGFLALAQQYEQLAAGGARWVRPQFGMEQGEQGDQPSRPEHAPPAQASGD